jgi:hypothetical protein
MTLEDVGPDTWRHCAALEVEMTLLIYPVVVGQGTRLFPDTRADTALDLVESRSTPSGVTIQTYRPTGSYRRVNHGTERTTTVTAIRPLSWPCHAPPARNTSRA